MHTLAFVLIRFEIKMTKSLPSKFLRIALPLWCGAMLMAAPAQAQPADYAITTTVTPAPSAGQLVCTSTSVPAGGSVTCSAVPASGYVFDDEAGFAGCDQPGDLISGPYNDICTMNNVQGPRSLTANFVPFMTPPTNIDARPDGQGNLVVSWTPPTHNGGHEIGNYTVWVAPVPFSGDFSDMLGNQCFGNVSSCIVSGYQTGQAYGVAITVFNAAGAGEGHFAYSEEMLQVATLGLPGASGYATVRWHGPNIDRSVSEPESACMLSSSPSFTALSAEDLQSQDAPFGATAPLGALQFQATGCGPDEAMRVVIDYPVGTLAGLQTYKYGPSEAGATPGWFAHGAISGDTVTYSLINNGVGDNDSDVGAINDPFAPLAVPLAYTIGGSIVGLTGDGLVLHNNGGDGLPIVAQATNFVFATPVVQGSAFAVTVQTQPAGQTCTVTSGTGVANSNVTNVSINCRADSGPGTGGVQAVPTLGQWGLLLLIALAGLLGWRMQRRL